MTRDLKILRDLHDAWHREAEELVAAWKSRRLLANEPGLFYLCSEASKDQGLETPHGQVDGAASAKYLDTALFIVDQLHLTLDA